MLGRNGQTTIFLLLFHLAHFCERNVKFGRGYIIGFETGSTVDAVMWLRAFQLISLLFSFTTGRNRVMNAGGTIILGHDELR